MAARLAAMGPPPTRIRIMGARYLDLVRAAAGLEKTNLKAGNGRPLQTTSEYTLSSRGWRMDSVCQSDAPMICSSVF